MGAANLPAASAETVGLVVATEDSQRAWSKNRSFGEAERTACQSWWFPWLEQTRQRDFSRPEMHVNFRGSGSSKRNVA